jgi:DNA polymerase sigma
MVLLLKMILLKHGLNQPYSGGLNSYSLVLMATAFLGTYGLKNSISKNFREFLNVYGSYFKPKENYIDRH